MIKRNPPIQIHPLKPVISTLKKNAVEILREAQWWMVFAVVIFSTVAFGGVHPPALFIIRLLIIGGVLVQVLLSFLEDRSLHEDLNSVSVPALFFGGFLVLVWLQSSLGVRILEGVPIGSVNAEATKEAGFQLIFYFLFFLICCSLASKQRLTGRLLSMVSVFVFFITVLGITQKLMGDERVLWRRLLPVHSAFFGPFLNENHFGGFLGLTFPLLLALMHERYQEAERRSESEGRRVSAWRKLTMFLNSGGAFFFFLITLTLGACFFSLARVSSLVLLLCCTAYFAVQGLNRRNIFYYSAFLIVLAGSFLFLNWIGHQVLDKSFDWKGLMETWVVRFNVAHQSLNLWFSYPLFGTGLGTYQFISSKTVFQFTEWFRWNHAHNDYVELLVETGVVGFCLFVGGILTVVAASILKARKAGSAWGQPLEIQAFVAILGIGVMECFDYHLRIPALALLFALQLAILSQARRVPNKTVIESKAEQFETKCHPEEAPLQDDRRRAQNDNNKIGAIFAFLGLMVCLPLGQTAFIDYRVYRLSHGQADLARGLEQALRLRPSNAELWFQLGNERREALDAAHQLKAVSYKSKTAGEMISAYRRAADLSPTNAFYWHILGRAEYKHGDQASGVKSLEESIYWAPWKPKYLVALLKVYINEVDKMGSWEERSALLIRTLDLYERTQHLYHVPTKTEYRQWLGERHYRRLMELISHRAELSPA